MLEKVQTCLKKPQNLSVMFLELYDGPLRNDPLITPKNAHNFFTFSLQELLPFETRYTASANLA